MIAPAQTAIRVASVCLLISQDINKIMKIREWKEVVKPSDVMCDVCRSANMLVDGTGVCEKKGLFVSASLLLSLCECER